MRSQEERIGAVVVLRPDNPIDRDHAEEIADWADCEEWVRGAKKTRYKKIRSAAELAGTLARWGVDAQRARGQLGC